jgi:hypothetical protein
MSPVRTHHGTSVPSAPRALPRRLYTVLIFDGQLAAPWAILVDAESDAIAIEKVRSLHTLKRREIWRSHRLVATIPAERCAPSTPRGH